MNEIYRKWGRVVRYEHGQLIRVDEAGEAIESAELFTAAPLDEPMALPEIDATDVEATARAIESLVRPERLHVSEGLAEHEMGDVRWSERTRRLHLSMIGRRERAMVDLGSFDLEEIRPIAEAMARIGDEREPPPRIRLAPNVTAALLSSLIGIVEVIQTAAPFDGKGQPIEEHRPPWLNWYRPSYRIRPTRMPFHLRAVPFGDIERDAVGAIALLAPVERNIARVLCVEGLDVFPATIAITTVTAVGEPLGWYPYGAGVFGAEMMIRRDR
jgi:hypothetical protein